MQPGSGSTSSCKIYYAAGLSQQRDFKSIVKIATPSLQIRFLQQLESFGHLVTREGWLRWLGWSDLKGLARAPTARTVSVSQWLSWWFWRSILGKPTVCRTSSGCCTRRLTYSHRVGRRCRARRRSVTKSCSTSWIESSGGLLGTWLPGLACSRPAAH